MENLQIEKRTVGNTEVFIGEKIIKEIPTRLSTVFEEGALFVVYEKDKKDMADCLMQELKKAGYRVFAGGFDTAEKDRENETVCEIPDYIRYVFAVGEEAASTIAKRICREKNIGWSLLLCTPTSDNMMCGICPKQVFIDSDIVNKSTKSQIASGYGIVLASKLTAFEDEFSRKVLSEDKPVKSAFDTKCDVPELAYRLLEISDEKDGEDSAERMAKLMFARAVSQGKKTRLIGEYRFLCASLITAFYSAFLGAPSIDCVPPACIDDALDKISSLPFRLGNEGKCVDFFDVCGYFRISYILSEYRVDLLEKLANIDLHGMQRFWRRLYPDAGYWLKSEISAKEALDALALAGAVSDNLLGYAYASGMLKAIG